MRSLGERLLKSIFNEWFSERELYQLIGKKYLLVWLASQSMGQTCFDSYFADQDILQRGDMCLSDHCKKSGSQSNELIFHVWS